MGWLPSAGPIKETFTWSLSTSLQIMQMTLTDNKPEIFQDYNKHMDYADFIWPTLRFGKKTLKRVKLMTFFFIID